MVENAVFRISYNEKKEQPNWIEYTVRDFVKVADRGNMDFYTVRNVWTSDDNDYYKNEWDKGHMAPAGSFTDSWSNLAKTFSFVNCALQKIVLIGSGESLRSKLDIGPKIQALLT